VTDASLQPILVLLGDPVAGNPTQFMMEKAFAQLQLDYRFLSVEVSPDHLAAAVAGIDAMGFLGAICAAPHQQAVLPHLPALGEVATLAGSVNLICRRDGKLVGENHEGAALLQLIAKLTDLSGKHAVLLGAGRLARVLAVEMVRAGLQRLTIVNRTPAHGAALASMLREKLAFEADVVTWDSEYVLPAEASVVVNATSLGGEDEEDRLPLAIDSFRPEVIAVDTTLNPPRTAFLREASERGCKTIDGLEIFLLQSAIAIHAWTGLEPDPTTMREAVEEFLLL